MVINIPEIAIVANNSSKVKPYCLVMYFLIFSSTILSKIKEVFYMKILNQKGLTLIEILAAVVILMIVIVGFLSFGRKKGNRN